MKNDRICIYFMYLTVHLHAASESHVIYLVEKDLNMGDHGYARRQPPVDSEEDGVQGSEEERPCSLCQHYKTKLEQQQQHTVRLQREVILSL